MSSHIANILTAFVSVAVMAVPNAATAQRTTITTGLSGQMLPLQPLPPGMQPAVTAAMTRIQRAECNPAKPSGGPGPASFYFGHGWPTGLEVMWVAVPGAVAYVVERAVDDGTNKWVLAGSTCGSPDAIREHVSSGGQKTILFRDITGSVRLGETYVYKVTALGAAGEVGWNSFRWWPSPLVSPTITKTTVTGSTIELTVSQNCFTWSKELVVTAPYGLNRTVLLSAQEDACPGTSVVVYGVPEGTHVITVAALWTQELDRTLPRVLGTSNASTTITIKP